MSDLFKKIGKKRAEALAIAPDRLKEIKKIMKETKVRCPEKFIKAYQEILKKVHELQDLHHKLPSDSETYEGAIVTAITDYDNNAKLMLERTTCIQQEIGRMMQDCNLFYLADNAHIVEEIELLQKDMDILKEVIYRMKRAGLE